MVAGLGVDAGAVVGALGGVLCAGFGTGSLQGFAAGLAEGQMGVAVRVGAVDEPDTELPAVVAVRNYGGIHAVHVHGHTSVEHVALAVEILAPGFDAVLDDAAVQLVHVLETLQGACSEACAQHPAKRAYDGTGIHAKPSNHYRPAQGLASYGRVKC